jgi:hypothetical protein
MVRAIPPFRWGDCRTPAEIVCGNQMNCVLTYTGFVRLTAVMRQLCKGWHD